MVTLVEGDERDHNGEVILRSSEHKRRVINGFAGALGCAGLVLLSATAAHAVPGGFTSTLEQVQPTFQSRTWNDSTSDATRTVVRLGSCKTNPGGGTPSSANARTVSVALYRNGGFVQSIQRNPCGTYDFGARPTGNYYFRIAEINGKRNAESAGFRGQFLNATVRVNY